MKYKVTGYKKVVYDCVEVEFDDNENLDIEEQAREQLEYHDFEMETEIDVEYVIENLKEI